MKRLAAVLLTTLVALAGLGAGTAAADTFYAYTAPGETFSPGEGHGSVYDNFCSRWTENDFSKAGSAYGMITFIDPNGNWSNTLRGTGWLERILPSPNFAKKLYCKNVSGTTYQGGCFGFRNKYPCV
jgi:hypothetical protein